MRFVKIALVALVMVTVEVQAESPRAVLRRLVAAEDWATMESAFPDNFVRQVRQRTPEEQRSIAKIPQEFRDEMRRGGFSMSFPTDDATLIRFSSESGALREIRVRREVSDGSTAVLVLEMCESTQPQKPACELGPHVWMRNDGGWKLSMVSVGGGHSSAELDFEDPGLLKDRNLDRAAVNESSAIGSLRTLNTSLVTYSATWPDKGLPDSLAELGSAGGEPGAEATSERAMLIDDRLACANQPCVRDGYQFEYTKISGVEFRYVITARPVAFGDSGRRSFYSDQNGVIRVASEDRYANANDPPLN